MALQPIQQTGQQQSQRRDSAMDDSPSDVKERVMSESQKAYIAINAVGAIVLLVFLQAIWASPGALALKKGVLYGIVAFAVGVAVATLGYAVRNWSLRGSRLIGPLLHTLIPLLVVASFLTGVILPVLGGFDSLPAPPPGQAGQPKDGAKKR